jgi:hypothetical protein
VATPGKNNDHVGVILSHSPGDNGSWSWRTAEGGQSSGFLTKLFDRRLEFKDGQHWHGEGQYRRPVVKWIDLDALAKALASG